MPWMILVRSLSGEITVVGPFDCNGCAVAYAEKKGYREVSFHQFYAVGADEDGALLAITDENGKVILYDMFLNGKWIGSCSTLGQVEDRFKFLGLKEKEG